MGLVGVGGGLQGKTLDAASPHATTAAAALETAIASQRVLLLKSVVADGQLLVVARIEAVDRGGALHVGAGGVVAVNDRGAALGGAPFLGEASDRLRMLRLRHGKRVVIAVVRRVVVVSWARVGVGVGGGVGGGGALVVGGGGGGGRRGRVRI